jgi:hypothetical protein
MKLTRDQEKLLREQYRERAVQMCKQAELSLKVSPFASVSVMDDGAFIEVTLWVPAAEEK